MKKLELKVNTNALNQMTSVVPPLPAPYQEIIDASKASKNFRMLTVSQVAEQMSAGVSTVWLQNQKKMIPPPVKLSVRSVRWIGKEIDALLEARVLACRSGLSLPIVQFIEELTKTRINSAKKRPDGESTFPK